MTPWHYTERLLPLFPHSPSPPTTTIEDRHVRTRALRTAWRSSKWSGVQYRTTSSKATANASRNETPWHHVGSKFNERAPTSQSRRGHGHTLPLRLYTHTYDLLSSTNGTLRCNFNRFAGCKIIFTYTCLLFVQLTTRANIIYSSQQFKCSMRDVRQWYAIKKNYFSNELAVTMLQTGAKRTRQCAFLFVCLKTVLRK